MKVQIPTLTAAQLESIFGMTADEIGPYRTDGGLNYAARKELERAFNGQPTSDRQAAAVAAILAS
ncbi:hypothetical protein UFOVP1183_6 [uncultured Caudovirales phage]|uniref:Uncharacterized protein n=1 Tax=uncultured Caudovirales phage TaxID=2100421 RepID=A0A6J5PWS4_9CAUD|nr:hypothetical protein UFOVP955_27 [uncultured Caudovirales phage]CAB4185170.1 hypothetical protein UFOVP1120_12 [uncultured Caudovirales phage]CAB4188187.1 hypothetical protein UFOVP1183_6 [uncultured Caudovirales phage]CAB4191437.1 hypothetical protein UFOVP1227_38 [uncultured Caudovirales phage]CAB5229662.1 hypothetical protein UFOVP1571_12 [uncultured Caudovirales phage]